MELLRRPLLYEMRKRAVFLESSQGSIACVPSKSKAVYRRTGAITLTGKMEVLGEGPVPVPVGPPQISQRLA